MPGRWLSRGARHVEGHDLFLGDPGERRRGLARQRARPVEPHDPAGLAHHLGELRGERGAARDPAAREDQRGVAVAHVQFGALAVAFAQRLVERVGPGDPAVLGAPAARAPAARLEPHGQRRVECRPVHAGLPAGDDLLKHAREYIAGPGAGRCQKASGRALVGARPGSTVSVRHA
jgi:hypothetical protein